MREQRGVSGLLLGAEAERGGERARHREQIRRDMLRWNKAGESESETERVRQG